MDLVKLGSVFRAVRVRRGERQSDVAAGAGVSQTLVSHIERGHLGDVRVDRLLRVAAALEIAIDWTPRWKGGELDRMLNAGHGALHAGAAELLRRHAWLTAPETTFFRDTATNRRRVAAHAGVLRSAFPVDGNEMRSWLARPEGQVAGLSFIAIGAAGSSGVRRVRGPGRSSLSAMRPGTVGKPADGSLSPP
jgi:transcriptional regulator with XRE-family HTH domain